MKNCSVLLPIIFLFWACAEETIELPNKEHLVLDQFEEDLARNYKKHRKSVQKADVHTFQPAGGFGGETNVLNEGDFFPPSARSKAYLLREKGHLGFRLYATGLPAGAYTVWWVIFNDPGICNEPNLAGGVCGGEGPNDLFLPTTSVTWATGGIVQSNGFGYFTDQIRRGELRDETPILGSDLTSPLQSPFKAEVHLIVKYHGLPSSDPEILYAQTHTLLGNCDGNGGANSYELPPPFGPYQCFDPQFVVFPSKIRPI